MLATTTIEKGMKKMMGRRLERICLKDTQAVGKRRDSAIEADTTETVSKNPPTIDYKT